MKHWVSVGTSCVKCDSGVRTRFGCTEIPFRLHPSSVITIMYITTHLLTSGGRWWGKADVRAGENAYDRNSSIRSIWSLRFMSCAMNMLSCECNVSSTASEV